jgi:hypothetical protein
MSKSHKKGHASNIPPATLLRSRLDGLWQNPALTGQEPERIQADLDVVTRGVKPDMVVTTLLQAWVTAPPESRARLDQIVPGWLRDRGHLGPLQAIAADVTLEGDRRERALAWLAAAGVETQTLARPQPSGSFYRAYFYGDDSQAIVNVFWYTDGRKTHVRGFNFLIDYNPPWEGAVKDIILYPQRTPQVAQREFVERCGEHGMRLKPITDVEAKQKILAALDRNRTSEIRLPRDLIAARLHLIRQVLSLPDGPNTPSITTKDVDLLCRNGQRPEDIMRYERTVGRRVRMDDGKELLVMGDPSDWPDEE